MVLRLLIFLLKLSIWDEISFLTDPHMECSRVTNLVKLKSYLFSPMRLAMLLTPVVLVETSSRYYWFLTCKILSLMAIRLNKVFARSFLQGHLLSFNLRKAEHIKNVWFYISSGASTHCWAALTNISKVRSYQDWSKDLF